jgi:sugar O-acyltransferase (sialic acid O-acetyltransferase NeuD family)
MREDIVIVGAGGHGREVFDIVTAVNHAFTNGPRWNVLGFVDDRPSSATIARVDQLGVPLLGPTSSLREVHGDARYVIGVGCPRVRAHLGRSIESFGLSAAQLIHPTATVGSNTVLSDGVVMFAGARVTTNVVIGRHVHVNQNATVGHDSVIADYVSVNPLAAVSGDCRLESGVLVGTNASILQGLTVHVDATVGAGACVVRDVSPRSVVVGVPARERASSDRRLQGKPESALTQQNDPGVPQGRCLLPFDSGRQH